MSVFFFASPYNLPPKQGKASKGFNLPLLALLPFSLSGELLTISPEVAPVWVLRSAWIVQNQIWILIPFAHILKGKVVPWHNKRGNFPLC